MRIWAVFTLFSLLACSLEKPTSMSAIDDPHSFSQPHKAVVNHLNWAAGIDFSTHTIHAVATWNIQTSPGADTLTLDVKSLSIEKILLDNTHETKYNLGMEDPILGQSLSIPILPGTRTVSIYYKTRPESEALQWLNPEQTAGKKHPFLFTQSQAILARSWIPCQDSPSVRFTYNATVTVPTNLLALMSASNPQKKKGSGIYTFEMSQPIPSYLLALAVGDIYFKPISQRSGVYAEPSLLEKAAWEFADLEKMIEGAEQLYGPYRWERYDVIVLPPSFPFGGMENPRLTFATPTILAGDRSLTSLIAHELAHSWSGNLVTNATWNDFWLNEGFTVYFETRIMEKIYGGDYAEMLASLNLHDLEEEIASLRDQGLPQDTKLKLNLMGRNPDDGVTDIAYNKGYFFLRYIEETWGREKFDIFLEEYFTANAFTSIDTESFITYIRNYYLIRFDLSLPDSLLENWIFGEGLPVEFPKPISVNFQKVDNTFSHWKETEALDKQSSQNWSTHEWLRFLKKLPPSLSPDQLQQLDDFGGFTDSGNAEIITVWAVHAIRNQYEKMYPKIESFLIETGRRKFLVPLYTELVKTEEGKKRAQTIYRKARPNYHFVAVNTLDKVVGF